MSDREFEEFATATMNLESAIDDFVSTAEKAGYDDEDIASRLVDAIYNGTDGTFKASIETL